MACYTIEHDYKTDAIVTGCAVTEAVSMKDDGKWEVPKIFTTDNCMWDTGATNSLITQKVVDYLGLKPIGKAQMGQAMSEEETDVYLVHIVLPTRQTAMNVKVLFASGDDYDVVIGMDIITQGDLAITNAEGKTVFSYRRPSKEHIRLED